MRRLIARSTLVLSLLVVGLGVACQQAPPPAPPDTRAADEQAVRDADAAFSKAAEAGNLDATVAFYADDALVLASNSPLITGKDSIRKLWSDMFAVPGLKLTWKTTHAGASRGGDMVYVVGSYDETSRGPKGTPVVDRGKYVEVWTKQPGGQWKVMVDAFNTDLPMPEPAKK